MENKPAELVIIISFFPVFVAAIYACFIFRRLDKKLQLFSIFLFLSALIQLASGIMWWNKMNNLPLLHLYVAGGFVCIALFYREVFREVLHPGIILFVCLAFVVFTLLQAFPIDRIFRFNAAALTVESVLIIIFSLATFLLLLNESAIEIHARKTLSWINSGFFIYYTSSLLIFYFSDVMARMMPVYINQNTWILHSCFSMIMYSCFIIALWKRPVNSAF